MTSPPCECAVIGDGLPLFRIRQPERKFEDRLDLGPDRDRCVAARTIVTCRRCGSGWIRVRINLIGKSEDDWVFPRPSGEPSSWDWDLLIDRGTASGGWRGAAFEPREVW